MSTVGDYPLTLKHFPNTHRRYSRPLFSIFRRRLRAQAISTATAMPTCSSAMSWTIASMCIGEVLQGWQIIRPCFMPRLPWV